MMKKIVLSICGGGVWGRGVMEFLYLSQQRIADVRDAVDVFAGTSVGAIICALYASGKSTNDIRSIFIKDLDKMFKKNPFYIRWKPWGARYSSKSVNAVLKSHFGNITMDQLKKECYIVAFESYNPTDPFGGNYKVFSRDDIGVPVWKAVRASMSAKPYFDPFEIDGVEYVDGGFCENNPSMTALSEMNNNGDQFDDIELIQLNTSGVTKNKRLKSMGYTKFALWFIGSSIRGDVSGVTIQTQKILKKRGLIISPRIRQNFDLDDVRFVPEIKEIWKNKFNEMNTEIHQWINRVRG